jgi:hypothetical protein
MRLLLAGTLATLTAAGLAAIPTRVLTDEDLSAARAIRENRLRADVRFLATREDRVVREYVAARFEAIGLEPGAPGGSWEQPLEVSHRMSANVIGRLPGRDPEVAGEAVVYDGALGNASGLASMLAIAEAFAARPVRPRRSILFAAVATGEQGGRAPGIRVIGLGRSTLDDWIRAVAQTQGRAVVTEAPTAEWDLAGAVEDARLLFHVGARVADAPQAPEWRPGDELAAARKTALAELGR